MRIAMIGAGAMGAMFGARFARAGADVVLYDVDADHIGGDRQPTGFRSPIPSRRDRIAPAGDRLAGGDRRGRLRRGHGRQQRDGSGREGARRRCCRQTPSS